MDFHNTATTVLRSFDEKGLHYAFIGGLALSAWGVFRATTDVDLLILSTDTEHCHSILTAHLYERFHHTENLSQYRGTLGPLGGIDLLHAAREPSRRILARAPRRRLPGLGEFPVCLPEDLIGLKLQALRNDPRRQDQERADIEALLVAAKEENRPIDWAILEDYGLLLGLVPTIEALRKSHG